MEKITAKKVDDFTIEITKEQARPEPIVQTYERGFLEKQLIAIQAQKDEQMEARDREMAEVQEMLDLCDEQGVLIKKEESSATIESLSEETIK